jgi:diguanylate cyclase (GGDEF)-like protein
MRIGSLIDITARREAEDRLKFLSIHDKLTGLYNRAFFEEQLEAIRAKCTARFSLICCDIDGLKLVNDAFGHVAGDGVLTEVGRILGKCVRKGDVVARTGGDEFAILMRGAGHSEVQAVYSAMRKSVQQYNDWNPTFPLSVSLGFAVANAPGDNPYDLFKLADNNMYREKLVHGQSVRSNIVQIAMKALGERDFITEGHAERLRKIIGRMATAFGRSIGNPADMILLAEFHDIGKVGIPDHILFKQGPLTREEFSEMQRHCEIGQRIALSTPELAPIADWILKHHERWDGNGYPLMLKGEEIPLACRILAIADSYDAMTSDRPYREALSHQEALVEILGCSGSQFDPHVVQVFAQMFEQGVMD